MKEIGELFKETREQIGIKIEEAAADLEVTEAQIENLEDGSINAFKDVFFLKDLIKKYCKYLNLDENDIINDFNDFLFDYTSKIPVSEIEEKIKEQKKTQDLQLNNNINSPYTKKKLTTNKVRSIIFCVFVAVLIITVAILITNLIIKK